MQDEPISKVYIKAAQTWWWDTSETDDASETGSPTSAKIKVTILDPLNKVGNKGANKEFEMHHSSELIVRDNVEL